MLGGMGEGGRVSVVAVRGVGAGLEAVAGLLDAPSRLRGGGRGVGWNELRLADDVVVGG